MDMQKVLLDLLKRVDKLEKANHTLRRSLRDQGIYYDVISRECVEAEEERQDLEIDSFEFWKD